MIRRHLIVSPAGCAAARNRPAVVRNFVPSRHIEKVIRDE